MIKDLSDEALEERLAASLGDERECLARFLEHLIEFDERKLGQRRSYSSTFDYCWKKLRLTEDESYKRIQAARAAKKTPRVLEMVRKGHLGLGALVRIAPHIEKDESLLDWAVGRSTRELEVKAAALGGAVVRAREVVQFLPAAPVSREQDGAESRTEASLQVVPLEIRADGQPILSSQTAEPPPAGDWEVRLHFTASKRLFEKLERARDLSRHKRPDGHMEEIVEDALDALLTQIDRDLKARPAPERDVLPGRRRIPEWVKDAVWKRDGGACAFEADGRRCGATGWVEYDHITPFSRGGVSDDPANVRLLCRAHNQLLGSSLTGCPGGSSVEA